MELKFGTETDKRVVLDFINRRFPIPLDMWQEGNCFYFAKILQARFSKGVLYYDVIKGHFVTKIGDFYYDSTGVVKVNVEDLVCWETYDDISHCSRIIENCIL